jgi:hypothetical protein
MDVDIDVSAEKSIATAATHGSAAASANGDDEMEPPTSTPPCMRSPSELQTPAEVARYGLALHSVYKTVHCLQPKCLTAVRLDNVVGHLKSHSKLSAKERSDLMEFLTSWGATSETPHVSTDPPPAPVEGLSIYNDGHVCCACGHCIPAATTFATHWSRYHRYDDRDDRFRLATLQTFYQLRPVFFEVVPPAEMIHQQDLFSIFLRERAPQIHAMMADSLPKPFDAAEIHPLLRFTDWDSHLAAYIDSRKKIKNLLGLMKLPAPKDTSYFGRLRQVIADYMDAVGSVARNTPVIVRQMLMVFPR